MSHHYGRVELPADGLAAATACVQVEPTRPPGTSCEIRAVAGRIGHTAQVLRDVLRHLGEISCDGDIWQGRAAAAFHSILQDPQRIQLDQVPNRYDNYARALMGYASGLDDHQRRIDDARRSVQNALDTYRRALATAPTHGPGPAGPTQFADADARREAAAAECRTAAVRFTAAYDDWAASANAAVDAIKAADGDVLHNPHGGHVAVDLIAHWTGTFASVTGALAVLALPWPPVALAFLELSSALSLIALSADATRREAYHEHVTNADLAVDALGTIPAFGPARRGAQAARYLESLSAFDRAAAGLRFASRSFRSELTALGPALQDLAASGGWQTLRHPDPRLASTLVRTWDGQDGLALSAKIGHETTTHRRQGYRQAVTKSTFSVVLGPLATPALTALDELAAAARGPRPSTGH